MRFLPALFAIAVLTTPSRPALCQPLSLDQALGGSAAEAAAVVPTETTPPSAAVDPAADASDGPAGDGNLAAVRRLLAGTGQGRVTDAQADMAAKRLAKLRADAAERRGGETAALLAECDANGDGRVSLPEARAAVAEARPAVDARAAVADDVVAAIDQNGDGRADEAELAAFVVALGTVRAVVEPLAAQLWNAADTSRDDCIDVAEARMAADQFGRLLLYSGGGEGTLAVEDPAAWLQVVGVIERADADGSTGLSPSEVAGTTIFKAEFAGMDRNRDGEVSAGELYAKAAGLTKSAQSQTCATCPLVQKAGAEKLDLVQSLLTLR